ncbi:hypothetical protein QCA50_011126 [Cerrena zonata]|uniref:Uncharacterized protein n=1 Tax=Cerrena zonata TaxID=2478898 RepID=A0AAW0G9S3_9APHY
MGIFDISLPEGEQRSQERVLSAFVNELRKEGIKDVRIIAFKEAVHRSNLSVSVQWKRLIDTLNECVPLLPNGISPWSSKYFPVWHAGEAVMKHNDGSKTFLGSALIINEGEHSLHPCQIVVKSSTSFSCLVPLDSQLRKHDGRWELQPLDLRRMEWVPSSRGKVPSGRSPVQGGYERGQELYHARVTVRREQYIGITGNHLIGCKYVLDDEELTEDRDLDILCWKKGRAPNDRDNGSSDDDSADDIEESDDDIEDGGTEDGSGDSEPESSESDSEESDDDGTMWE